MKWAEEEGRERKRDGDGDELKNESENSERSKEVGIKKSLKFGQDEARGSKRKIEGKTVKIKKRERRNDGRCL